MSPKTQVIIIGVLIYSFGFLASLVASYVSVTEKPRWISDITSFLTGLISGLMVLYVADNLIQGG